MLFKKTEFRKILDDEDSEGLESLNSSTTNEREAALTRRLAQGILPTTALLLLSLRGVFNIFEKSQHPSRQP